jgi:hypothetical protein
MAAVNWPNVPFYIMSQVNFSDLVVAVNSDNQAVLEPLTGTADQLWVATADGRGGARLTNLLSKVALYARPADPTWVGAGPLDLSVPGACWVLDDYPSDGWLRIQCLPPSNNWWLLATAPQQGTGLILAGWNGGQLSEFKAMPETGEVTVSNVQYQLVNATNLAQPPVDSLAVVVDNTQGNTLLTQTITLTGTLQQSTQLQASESDTEGTVYTQSFSVEGTFDPVQVTATATFEENQSTTVGWSSGTTNTQTWEHDIQTAVTVPANKKYSFQQRVNYGQVTVPWTATGTFQSCVPGTKPYTFQINGEFTGLNATTAEIIVADVTAPQPSSAAQGPVLQTVPVSLSASTATVPAP